MTALRVSVCAVLFIALCGCDVHKTEAALPLTGHSDPEWQRVKECAAQAEHEFAAEGYKRGGLNSLTNHYNAKLGSCFVLLETTHDGSTSKFLFDAFDRKDYGAYTAQLGDPLVECYVLSPAGNRIVCKSVEEFYASAKLYMESQR